MNKNMLEAEMKLNGDTGRELAEALGIARGTLSLKMNETNGAEFTQGEIAIMRNRYHMTAEKVDEIFFAEKVS